MKSRTGDGLVLGVILMVVALASCPMPQTAATEPERVDWRLPLTLNGLRLGPDGAKAWHGTGHDDWNVMVGGRFRLDAPVPSIDDVEGGVLGRTVPLSPVGWRHPGEGVAHAGAPSEDMTADDSEHAGLIGEHLRYGKPFDFGPGYDGPPCYVLVVQMLSGLVYHMELSEGFESE